MRVRACSWHRKTEELSCVLKFMQLKGGLIGNIAKIVPLVIAIKRAKDILIVMQPVAEAYCMISATQNANFKAMSDELNSVWQSNIIALAVDVVSLAIIAYPALRSMCKPKTAHPAEPVAAVVIN